MSLKCRWWCHQDEVILSTLPCQQRDVLSVSTTCVYLLRGQLQALVVPVPLVTISCLEDKQEKGLAAGHNPLNRGEWLRSFWASVSICSSRVTRGFIYLTFALTLSALWTTEYEDFFIYSKCALHSTIKKELCGSWKDSQIIYFFL